jgi:hypothetical protein
MVCTAGACAVASVIRNNHSSNIQNAKCSSNHKDTEQNTLTDYQKRRIEEQMERIVEQDIRNGVIQL